jgi:imidazolonepropionase-like amidohydrolase
MRAVLLPDGDAPVDLWWDDAGRQVDEPVAGAQVLPGRFVLPGLVDAHAHPAVRNEREGPVALDAAEAAQVLSQWSAAGVTLVRDTGSPGGVTLDIEPAPGLPRVLAAGRFLAPADRYFPVLLPAPAPAEALRELALAELARGATWVKVIADFPPMVEGAPAGAAEETYPPEVLAAMIEAVHAAGGRVAVHSTIDNVADLVRAGVDSIEHGVAMDESSLTLMAGTGAAWTPTLQAVFAMADDVPEDLRRWRSDYSERLQDLLPLAARLGVPVLAGTDTAGTVVDEIVALADHGLDPAQALASASTTALRFLGEPLDEAGGGATLVSYDADPREDFAVLSMPASVVVAGVRVR